MKPLAGMDSFFARFPAVAARETRVIKLLDAQAGLPAGSYGFLEAYCNEPTCDCRRVLFQVAEERRPAEILATLNVGWETVEFYTEWLHGDERLAREMVGASLDPLNRQSRHAPALLRLFQELLLPDTVYMARLRRHYELYPRIVRPRPVPRA